MSLRCFHSVRAVLIGSVEIAFRTDRFENGRPSDLVNFHLMNMPAIIVLVHDRLIHLG